LTFRSGSIAADGSVAIDPTARLASVPKITTRTSRHNGDIVEIIFRPDEDLSERVIFRSQTHRSMVSRTSASLNSSTTGGKTFYATYTAYSDRAIPIVPHDASQRNGGPNKGMGLFPRKINGR
jgi:hypothetical protein